MATRLEKTREFLKFWAGVGTASYEAREALKEVDEEIAAQRATLRDTFAAAALTGLLADPDPQEGAESFARIAYRHADAMLAAREGK